MFHQFGLSGEAERAGRFLHGCSRSSLDLFQDHEAQKALRSVKETKVLCGLLFCLLKMGCKIIYIFFCCVIPTFLSIIWNNVREESQIQE